MQYQNSIRTLLFAVVSVGFTTLSVCNTALAQSFVPAHLANQKIIDGMRCPVGELQSSVLFCQVVVDKWGNASQLSDTHCFGSRRDDFDRAQLLLSRILRSQYEPAQISGEAVTAYLSMRVFFRPNGESCDISVYPNLGTQQDELGLDYFAPQEILTGGGWLNRVPRSLRSGLPANGAGMAFAMSVAVDELGQASDGKIESNNLDSDDFPNFALKSLESSRFIPLMVDGKPRPGRYFDFMRLTSLPPFRGNLHRRFREPF